MRSDGQGENDNGEGGTCLTEASGAPDRRYGLLFLEQRVERGARIELYEVKAPPKEWAGPREVFEASLEHEKFMTDVTVHTMLHESFGRFFGALPKGGGLPVRIVTPEALVSATFGPPLHYRFSRWYEP